MTKLYSLIFSPFNLCFLALSSHISLDRTFQLLQMASTASTASASSSSASSSTLNPFSLAPTNPALLYLDGSLATDQVQSLKLLGDMARKTLLDNEDDSGGRVTGLTTSAKTFAKLKKDYNVVFDPETGKLPLLQVRVGVSPLCTVLGTQISYDLTMLYTQYKYATYHNSLIRWVRTADPDPGVGQRTR